MVQDFISLYINLFRYDMLMYLPVKFNGYLFRGAIKVKYEVADTMLPSEFPANQLASL